MAIQSFRHKGLRRLFEHDESRGLPSNLVDKLRDMLLAIDTASTVDEIGFSGLALASIKRRLGRILEPYRQR
jgi:toxin HigB-1